MVDGARIICDAEHMYVVYQVLHHQNLYHKICVQEICVQDLCTNTCICFPTCVPAARIQQLGAEC